MRLFSYVVARDYGFGPNPFFGICTLATCKPVIRKVAMRGDWIIGTGSKKCGREGFVVFFMQVSETLTFNEYWSDERFLRKRPNLQGSLKQAFGDNIYRQDECGKWHQCNSHHSYQNGSPNVDNICNDTRTNRILIGADYAYWGGKGPRIEDKYRDYNGYDICALRFHKSNFPTDMVCAVDTWLQAIGERGYLGDPLDWT